MFSHEEWFRNGQTYCAEHASSQALISVGIVDEFIPTITASPGDGNLSKQTFAVSKSSGTRMSGFFARIFSATVSIFSKGGPPRVCSRVSWIAVNSEEVNSVSTWRYSVLCI